MIDLEPAARRMTGVLAGVSEDAMERPTPCPDASVGDLVDHVRTLTAAFTGKAAQSQAPGGPPPPPDAANLPADWRDTLPAALLALASAWHEPSAWEGMTTAGGIELPASVAGLIALDELLVHGWDLAVATGQPYDASDAEVEAAIGAVSSFEAPRDGKLFGPVVPVSDNAPALDRLLGLTGRDPQWRPPTS
jgi:uncharacterized protein (TIGR03086 family)